MTSLAIRIQELDDDQLEEFVDLWATQKSQQYVTVERVGGANRVARRANQRHGRSPAAGSPSFYF